MANNQVNESDLKATIKMLNESVDGLKTKLECFNGFFEKFLVIEEKMSELHRLQESFESFKIDQHQKNLNFNAELKQLRQRLDSIEKFKGLEVAKNSSLEAKRSENFIEDQTKGASDRDQKILMLESKLEEAEENNSSLVQESEKNQKEMESLQAQLKEAQDQVEKLSITTESTPEDSNFSSMSTSKNNLMESLVEVHEIWENNSEKKKSEDKLREIQLEEEYLVGEEKLMEHNLVKLDQKLSTNKNRVQIVNQKLQLIQREINKLTNESIDKEYELNYDKEERDNIILRGHNDTRQSWLQYSTTQKLEIYYSNLANRKRSLMKLSTQITELSEKKIDLKQKIKDCEENSKKLKSKKGKIEVEISKIYLKQQKLSKTKAGLIENVERLSEASTDTAEWENLNYLSNNFN